MGAPPFDCRLMGSAAAAALSAACCSPAFKVLCRSTKAGPSGPRLSPPSSLKSWTGSPPSDKAGDRTDEPRRSPSDTCWGPSGGRGQRRSGGEVINVKGGGSSVRTSGAGENRGGNVMVRT